MNDAVQQALDRIQGKHRGLEWFTEEVRIIRDEIERLESRRTVDDVIAMAREAGAGWTMNGSQQMLIGEDQIARFAAFVAAAERESMHREWVGMTDEEISNLKHLIDWTAEWSYNNFACAIEAKLKEKNA